MSAWLTTTPIANSNRNSSTPRSRNEPTERSLVSTNEAINDDPLPSSTGGKIPTAVLQITLNQLSVLVCNGIDLAESIGIAAKQCRHKHLSELLRRCHEGVNQGQRFSVSLQQQPGIPSRIIALIAAAEKTGTMPAALKRSSMMLHGELQLRSTIVSALIYPAILVLASTVVLNALVFFVLPQFSKVFASMGRPVPASTSALLACGTFARAHWMWLIGGAIGFGIPLALLRKHSQIGRLIDWLAIRAPLIRQAYCPLATGRMFTSIGNMLTGGITLLEATQLTKRSVGNMYFRKLLADLESDLLNGNSFAATIARVDFLPPEAAQMTAAAERTGRVAEVFTDLGAYYEEEGSKHLKRLVHLIEPGVILVMGGLVAGVVLSVMLPLLEMSSTPT